MLLLTHISIKLTPCGVLTNSKFAESEWRKVDLGDKDALLVGVCYHLLSRHLVNKEALLELLALVEKENTTHVLKMGDFNLLDVDFVNYITEKDQIKLVFQGQVLDRTQHMLLYQHVDVPTKVVDGKLTAMLDLVFMDDDHMEENLDIVAPLGKSDHIRLPWSLVRR